jgi:hypothetical protein
MPLNFPNQWGIRKDWTIQAVTPKEKVKEKIIEIVASKDFSEILEREIDAHLNSGAYNITEESASDYRLAKKIVHESLKYLADQYKPLQSWKI